MPSHSRKTSPHKCRSSKCQTHQSRCTLTRCTILHPPLIRSIYTCGCVLHHTSPGLPQTAIKVRQRTFCFFQRFCRFSPPLASFALSSGNIVSQEELHLERRLLQSLSYLELDERTLDASAKTNFSLWLLLAAVGSLCLGDRQCQVVEMRSIEVVGPHKYVELEQSA